MYRCQNRSCSQRPQLYQTGASEKKGPTHYCRMCGWGYWTHIVVPTDEQIKAGEKLYPKYTKKALKDAFTIEILKPVPPGEWGKSVEKKMIEQLGADPPYWLSEALRKIWKAKYLELYPTSKEAKESKK